MALHEKNTILEDLIGDTYASSELKECMSSFTFPKEQKEAKVVYNAIHDELLLDGNSKQNLATFCTTWMEPEVKQLMGENMDKNMIDKDEYPQTANIEAKCVHLLADLWNSPDAENTIGTSTTGSSEAAMLGGMALKWNWRARQRKNGKPTDKPNLVTGPVQICWHKFCRYWDVEIREIPMEKGRLIMSPEEVLKRCDENTIGVIPTLGVTYTCQYEPVKAVSDALDQFEKETGLDIPIHVDAASGGFLAPFMDPALLWDFRLPRVKSINASGHKFGLSPLGVGWIIWRDAKELPSDLIFNVNYLGGNMPTFALNFSRPGGEIIAQYYNFIRLGKEGYRKIHQACYDTAKYLAKEIEKIGPFEMVYNGEGGIPAVSWRLKENADVNFTLYDFEDRLRMRGWLVPAYSMPANRNDMVIQRILVKHGFSYDMANLLVKDMKHTMDYFDRHPVAIHMTHDEAGGYTHGGHS